MFEFEEIDYNDSPVESDEIVNDQTDDSSNEQLEHQAAELETESTDVLTGTDEIVEQEDAEIEVDSEGVQTDAEEIVEQCDAEPNTTDVDDGKTNLVIAVGCTGGKHRSVSVARELSEFAAKKGYATSESHRDLGRR